MNSYGCQGLLKHALQEGVHKHFLSSTSICSVETPHLCFRLLLSITYQLPYNNSLNKASSGNARFHSFNGEEEDACEK